MREYLFHTMILVCVLVLAAGVHATTILIDPPAQASPLVGETLTVSVKVEDVTDLHSYAILLLFDNAALKFTDIREEGFLKAGPTVTLPLLSLGWNEGEEGGVVLFENVADAVVDVNLAGGLLVANTRASAVGVNGTGALFAVTFEVLEARASVLLLEKTVGLIDYPNLASAQDLEHPIPRNVLNGTISYDLPPVVKAHSPGSLMLALQSTYDEANVPGRTYIKVWEGVVPIRSSMFLEFQVTMFSGNPVFSGTVDLLATDGTNLRDSLAEDQNGVSAHPSADLSAHARDTWYHRKISLDALAGKTVDTVMIATDASDHRAGIFRVYVDNIQITDGNGILAPIYMGEEVVPSTGTNTTNETIPEGVEGMSDYSVSVVGVTSVTPREKLVVSWAGIKNRQ